MARLGVRMGAGWQREGSKLRGLSGSPGVLSENSRAEGKRGHLELAQHGVTALLQVGQVQASLIILKPLEQGTVSQVQAKSWGYPTGTPRG